MSSGSSISLKDWALARGWSGRPIAQDAASGILIAALGALESHWWGDRPHGGGRASSGLRLGAGAAVALAKVRFPP